MSATELRAGVSVCGTSRHGSGDRITFTGSVAARER